MTNIAIVYPNQLFETKYLPYDINQIDHFIMVEDPIFFGDGERNLKFNLLKLIYQRACMKYYEDYLLKKKLDVTYIEWKKQPNLLFKIVKKIFGTNNNLHIIDPVDRLLEERIDKYSRGQNIIWYDTPLFLLTDAELESYVNGRKKKSKSKSAKNTTTKSFYQYSFYIWHRQHSNILLDQRGKPIGGKYSYDKYNRESLPSKSNSTDLVKKISRLVKTYSNNFYDEAISYCESIFKNYYPENYEPSNIYFYPITHRDSKKHLQLFIKNKLSLFGAYQDAMDFSSFDLPKEEFAAMTLYHSIISMQQNIGLLTPSLVQESVLNFYKKSRSQKKILSAVEGFIRQLNWREYSRLLYRYAYEKMTKNYFNNTQRLNKNWYSGNTGIQPVDLSIKFAFRYGYLHHIIRLMIMCNFMNLCQIHPDDVYSWFMEFSLDSYDWVMINNVYSMGLHADGGLTTTKPYISSSNYVRKMSNIKPDGYWESAWDILYYHFIYRNKSKLKGRGLLYVSHWDRQKHKAQIIKSAKKIISKLT